MMLHVEDIHLSFDREVIKGVSFALKEGQILGIAGKSGAGKTSLLKVMAGLLDADSGKVYFDEKEVKGPSGKLVPGHPDIQLVDQHFHLDAFHTVEENIREMVLYLPVKQRDKLVDELIELMELEDFRKKQSRYLSGGEQQRLALARALACEPRIILMDEPFAHIDARLRTKLINYFLALKNVRKVSLVLVSHDGAEMLGFADQIIHMKNGKIVRKSTPESFYYRFTSIEEARLFGAVNSIFIEGKRLYFRPDEYTLDNVPHAPRIKATFSHSLFTGPVYQNYFTTERKEKVVLYSFNNLQYVNGFTIIKKFSSPQA
jgi:ABC-type multidrug transport system ATPase subunit